jgi:hypothetical protein
VTVPDDRVAEGWRCSRCGSERPPSDGFCGLCGARMPRHREGGVPTGAVDATSATDASAAAGRTSPVVRSLVLAGIPLIGVAVALLVARPSDTGPAPLVATPATWRCGEAGQTWTTPIRAAGDVLLVEWRAGGIEGPAARSGEVGRFVLDAYRQGDGTYVIPAADVPVTADAACTLPGGSYTLVVVDTAVDQVAAAGPVQLEP